MNQQRQCPKCGKKLIATGCRRKDCAEDIDHPVHDDRNGDPMLTHTFDGWECVDGHLVDVR